MTKWFKILYSIGMTVSQSKSKVLSGHDIGTKSATDIIPLEKVECFKYLGAPVNIPPRKMLQINFTESSVKKASVYRGTTLSLAKSSPDPVLFAKRLWSCCAIPAIFYAAETLLLREGDLNKIAVEQHRIMRFCLQVPQKTTNVATQLALGLKQVGDIYSGRIQCTGLYFIGLYEL